MWIASLNEMDPHVSAMRCCGMGSVAVCQIQAFLQDSAPIFLMPLILLHSLTFYQHCSFCPCGWTSTMNLPQTPETGIPLVSPSEHPSDAKASESMRSMNEMHRLSVGDVQRAQQEHEEEHILKFNKYHSASRKKRLAIALRHQPYIIYCWEIMQIIVSIYAIVIFIFEMDCQKCKAPKFPQICFDLAWNMQSSCGNFLELFQWSEVAIFVLFAIDIVYCILIVEDFSATLSHAHEFLPDLLSMAGLAAVFTGVPLFVTWLRIFRPFRLLRQMRIYRTFWTTWAYPGTVAYSLTSLSHLLFASMYCIACLMVILERRKFESSWFVGFYYSCVTITTVGYGDYYPETPIGRVFVIGFLIIIVTRLPAILDNISALLSKDRKYRKAYRRRRGRHHVAVAGQFRVEQVRQFVQQLHDNDVGESFLFDIVLLGEAAPSAELQILLRSPAMSHVFYFIGNSTSLADLKRYGACVAVSEREKEGKLKGKAGGWQFGGADFFCWCRGLMSGSIQFGGGGWHKAMVLVCLPLAAPIGLSPLHIPTTPCGSERVLVVSTEPLNDLSCLTTPGLAVPETGYCPCR